MIRAYWNALRVDDAVLVHDDTDRGFATSAGSVAFVDTRAGDANAVTVRITDDRGGSRLVRPKRLAVHLRTSDAGEACWRCGLRVGPRIVLDPVTWPIEARPDAPFADAQR